jgi:hypothetical protein
MKNVLVSAALMGACAVAQAKLPPPDDATKAKAAETAARAGWQAKVDSFQLCRSQDKVVSHYRKTAATVPAQGAATPAGNGPQSAAPAGTPAAMVASSPSVPGGTAANVAGAPTPAACADPGPFAYTPPEQKPLEVSGAHSPTGTAVSPPSTNTPAAAVNPAKK